MNTMKMLVVTVIGAFLTVALASAYPPGVGITSKSRSCVDCHADNGPWHDDANLILDLIDSQSKKSLKQADGTFLITVPRGQRQSVLTVIGTRAASPDPQPARNGWAYVDTAQIATSSFSKFAPGWDVDLPMSCRAIGDTMFSYAGDHVTIIPMNVRPSDAAHNGEVQLQILLTSGEPIKGKPKEGLTSSYFLRRVRLEVKD